ncbi:MAG: hypothetical protein NZ553_17075 [Caldilinea sp.]|nr:hypothetical protein [Caldilinea sp.]MDW8442194.1 hypothetical protein [Caldilineaceae bacterium]
MRTTIERILADLKPLWRERGKEFTYRWTFGRQTFVEGLMARITNEQQVKVTVRPLTAAGRPARIDGEVEFISTDENVATISRIDAMSAMVISGNPGVTQIVATFDADLGEGVRPVEMSGALEVVEAEAERGEIIFGTPELKP